MASERYIEMQKSVTTLRRFMLPSRFSSTGLYSDRAHQRTAAFRLLVHAEFESYLEDVVTRHVSKRVDDWRKIQRPSITLAALLAYDGVAGKPPTSVLNPPQKPSGLFDDRLDDAVNRFQQQVRTSNHGVREANVLNLVLPIGIEASNLDAAWLADLDGWAQERGDLAHQSAGKVRLSLDPAREYANVKKLLVGFKALDGLIAQLP